MNYTAPAGRFLYGGMALCLALLILAPLMTRHAYLAALPPLALLFLLAIFHRPVWGLYLILLLVPFGEYRGFSDSYQFLTLSKLTGVIVVAVTAVSLVLKKSTWRFPRSKLWIWLSLFFLAHLLSLFLSPYKVTALDNVRSLVTAYVILALPVLLFTEKDFSVRLPLILLTSVTLAALLSIYGYVFQSPYFAMNVGSDAVTRGMGGSSSPNHFAAMIIFCLPLAWHFAFFADTVRLRVLAAMVFAINTLAIVLTFSRGGAIVASLTLMLTAAASLRRFKPKHFGFALAGILGVLLTFAALAPDSYWERQKSVTQTKTDPALGRRLTYLQVAADTFRDHPLFGVGPGAFKDIYSQTDYARQFADKYSTLRRSAHNTYLEILIGTGILGLLLFLAIILQAYGNFRVANRLLASTGDNTTRALITAYKLSLFSLLIYFFFLSSVYHKYFWTCLGLSIVAAAFAERKAREAQHGSLSATPPPR